MATARASFVNSFRSSSAERLISFSPPMVCVAAWKFHPTGPAPTLHRNCFPSRQASSSPPKPCYQSNSLLRYKGGKLRVPPCRRRRIAASAEEPLPCHGPCHRPCHGRVIVLAQHVVIREGEIGYGPVYSTCAHASRCGERSCRHGRGRCR